jgi:hypothetical protein
MLWEGHVTHTGDVNKANENLVWKLEGKTSEINIKIDLKKQ